MRVDSFMVTGLDRWAAQHEAYRARSPAPSQLPRLECLELTNDCNLRCAMCPRSGARPVGYLDLGFLGRLLEREGRWLQGQHVWLHFHGEPLLHPRLLEAVRLVRAAGAYPRLSTNCTLLTPEVSRGLIQSGLSYLVFSVDGWSPTTHRALRRGSDFEAVTANVLQFLRFRREMGATEPLTQVQFLDAGPTHEGIDRAWELWADSGVDFINIRRISSRAGQVRGWRRLRLPGAPAAATKDRPPCWWLWHATVVLCDGRVAPCCCDLEGSMILGDLRHQSLAEVWGGPAYRRLRQRQAEGRFEGLCARCEDWLGYHPSEWERLRKYAGGAPPRQGDVVRVHNIVAVGRRGAGRIAE
ncbi:MAG: radical SAM protein [Acetobacteraceae bacterium]|nr:radical SAM protein [Acetobacteraceae bacterium]